MFTLPGAHAPCVGKAEANFFWKSSIPSLTSLSILQEDMPFGNLKKSIRFMQRLIFNYTWVNAHCNYVLRQADPDNNLVLLLASNNRRVANQIEMDSTVRNRQQPPHGINQRY